MKAGISISLSVKVSQPTSPRDPFKWKSHHVSFLPETLLGLLSHSELKPEPFRDLPRPFGICPCYLSHHLPHPHQACGEEKGQALSLPTAPASVLMGEGVQREEERGMVTVTSLWLSTLSLAYPDPSPSLLSWVGPTHGPEHATAVSIFLTTS